MHHPSNWWTVACALAMALWSAFSTWRVRRIWAPAHAAHMAAQAAEEALASATTTEEKVRCAAEVADAVAPQVVALGFARQWMDHIYMPVMVTLAVPTLVLAVWGVL